MAQAAPQPPQFIASVMGSTQTPPQEVSPVMHIIVLRQVPIMQAWPAEHALAQEPQLAASVLVSTQVAPQRVWPIAQSGGRHEPALQLSPAAQALPQAPQFIASDEVSMQAAPQRCCPIGHIISSAQAPMRHTCVPMHAVPQAPQLAEFDWTSTHMPPQRISPVAQGGRGVSSGVGTSSATSGGGWGLSSGGGGVSSGVGLSVGAGLSVAASGVGGVTGGGSSPQPTVPRSASAAHQVVRRFMAWMVLPRDHRAPCQATLTMSGRGPRPKAVTAHSYKTWGADSTGGRCAKRAQAISSPRGGSRR
jgi:uncharacterized membrane protein YgcG